MIKSLLPLSFTPTLLSTACPAKQTTQASPDPASAPASEGGIKATLLQAAQAKPATSERTFCVPSVFTAEPTTLNTSPYENGKTQTAIRTGYFTVTVLGGGQYRLMPTGKYRELLQHARLNDSGIPRFCFGPSRLTALTNLQQAAPNKYLAQGKLTLEPEAWVTPEVLAAFGPTRNDPSQVPLSLVFYKEGDAWEAEKH